MSNAGDSPRDKQQLADMMTDYRALLTMTQPLIVTEDSLPAWRGGEVYRSGFGISPGPGDRCPESVLSKGEVFRSDGPDLGIADDEELDTTWDEMGTRPALQMRICIGMS
jgi:hypothetical protein